MRWLAVALVLTACTASPQPPAPPSDDAPSRPAVAAPELEPEHASSVDTTEPRGRFVGTEVGVANWHAPSGGITLPPGLGLRSAVHFADEWGYVVALDRFDLVILLVDPVGVVTDDVTLLDLGEHLTTVDCEPEVTLGLAAPEQCEEADAFQSLRAWTHDGPRLRELDQPAQCWCELVEDPP